VSFFKKKTPVSSVESQFDHAGRFTCTGCEVRQETIEFLRDQLRTQQLMNDQLQNKLLALTGDAADRYQKLRVMELASTNAPAMAGVLSMESMSDDEPVDEFDSFIDNLHGGLVRGNDG